jgi:hypothetical protein
MRPSKRIMVAMMSVFVWTGLVGLFAPSVMADDTLASFKGGIGVIPVRAGPAANIVRGVNPGGQPWVISKLEADVNTNGEIKVEGEGLLLGGGNSIGTTGGNSVIATLICGTLPNGPFTLHSSGAVPLEPNGDFRIDDRLSPAPPVPCDNPVLLIRSSGNGNWFAAGIPTDDDDD